MCVTCHLITPHTALLGDGHCSMGTSCWGLCIKCMLLCREVVTKRSLTWLGAASKHHLDGCTGIAKQLRVWVPMANMGSHQQSSLRTSSSHGSPWRCSSGQVASLLLCAPLSMKTQRRFIKLIDGSTAPNPRVRLPQTLSLWGAIANALFSVGI